MVQDSMQDVGGMVLSMTFGTIRETIFQPRFIFIKFIKSRALLDRIQTLNFKRVARMSERAE